MNFQAATIITSAIALTTGSALGQTATDCFNDPAKVAHLAKMYAARVISCPTFPEIASKFRGTPMSVNFLQYKTDTAACQKLAIDISWLEIRKAEGDKSRYCADALASKNSP